MKITTKTPIGDFVVDLSTHKVVHVVNRNGELILNQIVFRAVLENYNGEKEQIHQGLTFTTSINNTLMDKIDNVNSLFVTKDQFIAVYSAYGGSSLI